MKKIVFREKQFKSLEEFFKENKEIIPFKSSASLRTRLKDGLSLEEAIKKGKRKTGSPNGKFGPYIVENISYTSLPSIAKEYGLSERAIYKRYSRGKRGDDLIPKKKRKNYVEPTKIFKFYINGIGYDSNADACRKNNVKYITYRKRIGYGWSQEEALGIKKRENIHHSSIYSSKYHGKKRVKGKEIIIDNKKFNSLAEASIFYEKDPEAVRTLVLSGRTIREALGLDLIETKNLIIYKGKKYKNLTSLAKTIGMSQHLISSRIKSMGISLEEAISLGPEHISNEGRYNEKIFKKNPDLANSNGYLYFVSINIDNKTRYKIGITKNSVEKRLSQEGYKFSVIKKFNSTLLNCYLLEQKLIKKFQNHRDKDIKAEQLDGHTEIFDFSDDVIKTIKDLIK